MSDWYSDSEAIASIPVDDRAAQYGDGLFETIAIRSGAARLWSYHAERLQLGCQRLGIASPDMGALKSALDNAIAAADIDSRHALAKIIVTPGSGSRGYRRPSGQLSIRIGLFAADPQAAVAYQRGVRVRLCATRLAIQPQLAGIKSLNRLEQVLARAEWNQPEIFEGLTLDSDGRLICGTMSNVFAHIQGQLVTPALTRCGVSGVMRRHVLTLLDQNGIAVEARDIATKELRDIEEMFLTNSQFGVLPVAELDTAELPLGKLTRHVMALAANSGIGECAT